jgi:prepilin-type N-terminal cleavage/methylation domain-containing protein
VSTNQNPATDDGFTLLELLVVIVILGVLATVVVFAVGGVVDRGEVSALAGDARTLETAEESHYAVHGSYVDEAGLVAAGLLRDQSTLHDIEVSSDGASYTLATEGAGGGSTTVAPTATAPPSTAPAGSAPVTTEPVTTEPVTTAPATTQPAIVVTAVPTGYAGFSGQATGSGSKTLVIIGNGGAGTQALFTLLTTTPLPNTTVIWLDGSDVNDTGDVDAVIAAGPDYMVAADSVPVTRSAFPFGLTFVGQYMSALPGIDYPADFWWTHQQGNPTLDQLASHL